MGRTGPLGHEASRQARTWFLRMYCVSSVPPVEPRLPPEPGPEATALPGFGLSVLTGSCRSRSRLRLVFLRSSRYMGSACGLWMFRGTC